MLENNMVIGDYYEPASADDCESCEMCDQPFHYADLRPLDSGVGSYCGDCLPKAQAADDAECAAMEAGG